MKPQFVLLTVLIMISACTPSTSTPTPTNTSTSTPTATDTPVSTPTSSPTATDTPTSSPTYTLTPTTTLTSTPTETLTVTPTTGQSQTTGAFGPEGGKLTLGRFELNVPQNVFSAPVQIMVTQLSSQTQIIAQDLDPARFQPLGEAFAIDTVTYSIEPLKLSMHFEPGLLPAGADAQNLGVVVGGQVISEGSASTDTLFFPLPATVDVQASDVQANVFGSGIFQLVYMPGSLPTPVVTPDTENMDNIGLAFKVSQRNGMVQATFPVYEFINDPQSEIASDQFEQFRSRVSVALNNAYQVLVIDREFPMPPMPIEVRIPQKDLLPETTQAKGGVINGDGVIAINPLYALSGELEWLVAHEFFHVIQVWNSNCIARISDTPDINRWFLEGTAEWAMDEVYDTSTYQATDGYRLTRILTAEGDKHELAYQTVAFWKWLEKTKRGTIRKIILEHQRRSLSQPTTPLFYLDDLLTVYPDVRFQDYALAALYQKDFDENETRPQDIWGPLNLGPRLNVPVSFAGKTVKISDVTSPQSFTYLFTEQLTADVWTLRNTNCGTTGTEGETLDLKFEGHPVQTPNIEVAIAFPATGQLIRKPLSSATEEFTDLAFPPGSVAYVIIIAPSWSTTSTSSIAGAVSATVKKPAGYVPGKITDVNTVAALLDALHTVGSGNVVRLAPGTYYVPGQLWTEGIFGRWPASLILWEGVTLTGSGTSGADQTTIVLTGQNSGITGLDRSTLQNIRVVAQWWQGINTVYAHHFSVCNVYLEGSNETYGIELSADDGGHFDFQVQNSILTCTSQTADCAKGFGISVRGVVPVNVAPGTVTVVVRDTVTQDWEMGMIIFATEHDPQTILDVDCTGLHGKWRNVWIVYANYQVERCPVKP